MKDKTIPKAVPKKVKGTVLFTVVAVMMVLIVFLMGTLALAATVTKKSADKVSERTDRVYCPCSLGCCGKYYQSGYGKAKELKWILPILPKLVRLL